MVGFRVKFPPTLLGYIKYSKNAKTRPKIGNFSKKCLKSGLIQMIRVRKFDQKLEKSEKIGSFSKNSLNSPIRNRVKVRVSFRVRFPQTWLGYIKIFEKMAKIPPSMVRVNSGKVFQEKQLLFWTRFDLFDKKEAGRL